MKLSIRPLLTLIVMSMLMLGCSFLSPKKSTTTSNTPSNTSSASDKPGIISHTGSTTPIDDSRYSNLWDRIRAGYGLPMASDSQLGSYLRWYTNNQSYINRFNDQAELYLYYVVSEMETNGIPLELALIPIIESSYNPHVVSPSNTAGIWQFVPETGRNFGLKQNTWYNGRKDVIASTDAAIRYLKKLHADFGSDWLLVVAAYNAGEGTVANAIAKNKRAGKATDFWSLPLPKHTQTYIPQLLALAKVIGNPQHYNLSLKAIPNTPYFVKINVDKQIDIAQAAKQANINPNELKTLNSGMNGWLTAPLGGNQVLVPVADAAAFTLQLNSLPPISSSAINAGSKPETKKSVADIKKQKKQDQAKRNYYTVKSGENLWSIAKSQKISASTLAKLNDLTPNAVLKPGQKLLLLSQATP